MSGERVLIIDDEEPVRHFLRVALSGQLYEISEASSGKEGLIAARDEKPDVIILDLGLPDIDGVEVTRLVREWTQTPIIILSVRGSENDKIMALDAGGDDYLTKPFSIRELLARLRVALRRAERPASETIFTIGDLIVDVDKRAVTLGGKEVQLTPHEYGILKTLVMHSGKVITHRQLFNEVWGYGIDQEFHLLRVNVSNLRRKIEPDPSHPKYITTESGVGYRLKGE
jgi:two-component system, OmpR family, KDP operon response regulator KdpE